MMIITFTIIIIVWHAACSECIGNELDFELCFDCQPFLNADGLDDDDDDDAVGDDDDGDDDGDDDCGDEDEEEDYSNEDREDDNGIIVTRFMPRKSLKSGKYFRQDPGGVEAEAETAIC